MDMYIYICIYLNMHVNIYICIIWCIDCVFVTRNKHIFRRSCPLSLPFLGQETPDVAETEKPGTEKAGTVVFYVFFSVSFFFGKAIFPPKYLLVKKNPKQVMDIGVGIYGVNTGY